MRVLHVLPTRASEYGGPVRIAEGMCSGLTRAGYSVDLFPAASGPHGSGRLLAYSPGLRGLSALREKSAAADIVHVHGLWTVPTSAAAIFARALKRPFIITANGMLDRWSMARSRTKKQIYAALIERGNLDAASAIHFNSDEERDEAKAFGIRTSTFVLPNGIDVAAVSDLPGRDELWRRYPQTRAKCVLLFLGRIHPKKGLPLLVDALPELIARQPYLHVLVAGPDEGGHLAEVQAQVTRHDLQRYVTFTGSVEGEHKRLLLGGSDIFVLPSHQEGDSMAVKEALGAGLPVVITYPCHFRQVAEVEAGFVVHPVSEAIGQALERLCMDETLRARMGENARALIDRHYRWEVIALELAKRYEEVLGRHPAQPAAVASGVA